MTHPELPTVDSEAHDHATQKLYSQLPNISLEKKNTVMQTLFLFAHYHNPKGKEAKIYCVKNNSIIL